MSEPIDVVDHHDQVVCSMTRDDVHAKGLRHRAVSVWVEASDGTIWLQQRSQHKEQEPGLYSPTASGHVDSGESYAHAAHRELFEEAGMRAALQHVTTLPASPATGEEFTAIFVGQTGDRPVPCPVEVASMRQVTPADLAVWIAQRPMDFSRSFLAAYHWLTAHQRIGGEEAC